MPKREVSVFKTIWRYAWRYGLIAPPILCILFYGELILLNEGGQDISALYDPHELPIIFLGSLIIGYKDKGLWCFAIGIGCGVFALYSRSLASQITVSAMTMGCFVLGFTVFRGLEATGRLSAIFELLEFPAVAYAVLWLAQGAVAGAICAYVSFRKPTESDMAETFS